MDIVDDGSCFACGHANVRGLKLRFRLDHDAMRAFTETVLEGCYSGWKRAAHGGIVAAMLDEAMVYACAAAGLYVATATLTVRFRHPVPVGVGLRIEGQVTQRKTRVMRAQGRVCRDGNLLAEAEGVLAVMRAITAEDPLGNG